jgi:penicillin V acylase-like amidase (Ntn superfamily)
VIVFLSFFILILFYGISDACTTFFVNDSGKLIFGRSYDFDIGDGYVMVNKRNVRKSALGYENGHLCMAASHSTNSDVKCPLVA